MTIRLNPYLVLDGTAREAIQFYQKALGGTVAGVVTFADMPQNPDSPLPENARERIAHALVKIGDSDLMLSDSFPGEPHATGDQVTIMLTSSDHGRTQEIFEALQEGGQVLMPLQQTSWSPSYGIVKDKFGVTFQMMTEEKQ